MQLPAASAQVTKPLKYAILIQKKTFKGTNRPAGLVSTCAYQTTRLALHASPVMTSPENPKPMLKRAIRITRDRRVRANNHLATILTI